MTGDFVVVGGGVIGLTSAIALADLGSAVTVIDRGTGPASGSTGAAAGILSLLFPWEHPESLQRLADRSTGAFPDWCAATEAATGAACGWRRTGLLAHGVTDAPDFGTWRARHPDRVTVRDDGAVWMPEVAIVDPRALAAALCARAERLGVRFRWSTEIDRIEVSAGRVTGVSGGDTRVDGDAVLVAGGAWSARLLSDIGLRLPVRPVRGQVLELQGEPGVLEHILMRGHRYLLPRADGRVVVGSTVEEAGFDDTPTDEAAGDLRAFATGLLPASAAWPVTDHRSGLRPGSPQGIPWIGPVTGIDGLWVNAGHFRTGITLAPGSAELLAAMVAGRAPPLDPAAFRIGLDIVHASD